MKYSNKIIQSRKGNVYRKIIDRAPEGYLLNENTLETMAKILDPLILSTADDPSVDFFCRSILKAILCLLLQR